MATRTIYDCDRCKAKDLKFPVHLVLNPQTRFLDGEQNRQEGVDLCLICAQEILQSFVGDFDLETSARFVKAVRDNPAAQPKIATTPKLVAKVVLQQDTQ